MGQGFQTYFPTWHIPLPMVSCACAYANFCLLIRLWIDLQSYIKSSYFKLREAVSMACFSMQCSASPHKEEKLKFSAALQYSRYHQTGKIAGQVGIIQGEGLNIWTLIFFSSSFSSFFHPIHLCFSILFCLFFFFLPLYHNSSMKTVVCVPDSQPCRFIDIFL